jgi:hypothetical protein
MNMKEVVELFGGKYLFGGALIQFGEDSFKEMYKQIYDAAMLTEREACAELCDGLADTHEKMNQWDSHKTADSLAQAIRARTDHDTKEQP